MNAEAFVRLTRRAIDARTRFLKLLTDAVASAGEDDSAAASIAADAPVSVDGAESEDGTSPAATPAAGPVPAVDADIAVIQHRLGYIEDPIVRGRRRWRPDPNRGAPLMLKNLTITFDELERPLFDTVASPSILGGPEQDEKGPYPWTRLVRRAAQGEALSAGELAALKKVLEDSTAERETNVASAREAGNDDLASAFETWLDPLGEAWALVSQAESVALGGAQ